MDEAGQSGDAGAADGGTGADPHDRAARTGWASSGSPWSSARPTPDRVNDVPTWRRPATEAPGAADAPMDDVRPVPENPFPSSWSTGDVRAFQARPPEAFRPLDREVPSDNRSPAQPDPPPVAGPDWSGDPGPMTENAAAPRWSDSRSRYADLLAHLSPNGNGMNGDGMYRAAANGNPADRLVPNGNVLSNGNVVPNSNVVPNGKAPSDAVHQSALPSGAARTDPARIGPARTDPEWTDRGLTDRVPTGQAPTGQAPTGQVRDVVEPTGGLTPEAPNSLESSGDAGNAPNGAQPAQNGPEAERRAEPVRLEGIGRGDGPHRTSGKGLIEGQMGEPPRLHDPLDPGTEVRASDVRAADLRAADLRAADLRAADLRNADLRNADLRTAQLRVPDSRDRILPGTTPPASAAPASTVPGGTAPGGTAPGGTAPGGTAPGGTPPYRYDAGEAARRPAQPLNGDPRGIVPVIRPAAFPDRQTLPAVRPSTPGGRTTDRAPAESARHALERDTPPSGTPQVTRGQPPADQGRPGPPVAEPERSGRSYEPSTFPRRLPYEAPPARPPIATPPPPPSYQPSDPVTGYAAAAPYTERPGRDPGTGRTGERSPRALPQRVPGRPDVPTVPEPPSVEPPAETPALARIATHLRRGDVLPPQDRQEGFDVQAILAAVREVDGVRGASLRATPAGAHSLRLDLAEGADPAEVSRRVARLLQDTMGLDAAMQAPEAPSPAAPLRPATAYVPSQPVPAGRASVSGAGSTADAPVTTGPSETTPAPGTTDDAVPSEQLTRLPQAGRGRAAVDTSRARTTGEVTGPPISASGIVDRMPAGVEPSLPRPLKPADQPGPRVVIEKVQVNTVGTDATVEVQLTVGGRTAVGEASGPAVDGYLLRLCALATAGAVDELLAASDHVDGPARCYVEHAAAVPFGSCEVAVVVVLLSCGGWVEQLAGSSVVTGDSRHAMVRATLAAVNRRLEALLS